MAISESPFLAPWLQAIARALGPVYAVGGAVRNTLMGLPVSDIDLCGVARPDEVEECCGGTNVTVKLRAARFGTVELHVDGHMAEYTTFRCDSYRGGHQPIAVRFAKTIGEDAYRRDFSVNALYTPLGNPYEIIDPTGGLAHLKARILHTVTDDPDQVLKDDGLRILRAARFQAELGFTPTNAVLRSAKKHCGLLDEIVAERKRDELTKLLTADMKYPKLSRTAPPVSSGLHTLVRVGAWEKLFGWLEPIDFSVMDNTAHLDIGAKLALLYHRETPDLLGLTMTALHYSKKKTKDASDALAALQAIRDTRTVPADILRFGLPAVLQARDILLALADHHEQYLAPLERAGQMLLMIEQNRLPESIGELTVGGKDILRLCRETGTPKERIGAVLTALWRDAANGRVPNEREAMLAQARAYLIDSQNRE